MSGYVLGIDGGGTKTTAVVVGADALGSSAPAGLATKLADSPVGIGGPSNIAAVSVEEALNSVVAASSAALPPSIGFTKIASVCAAIAGFSQVERRKLFQRGLEAMFPSAQIDVVPDYVAAQAGALAGEPGIIVIAGTGSVAYGENGEAAHKAGAYGYLIDDAGSGYGAGRRALASVLRAADGTGPATMLTDVVAGEIGSADWFDVIIGVYGGSLDRKRIASLSRCVSQAATLGDTVARQILAESGSALADLALAVATKIFMVDDPAKVSLVGSLWDADVSLSDAFSSRMSESWPSVELVKPKFSPHVGAALIARRMIGVG